MTYRLFSHRKISRPGFVGALISVTALLTFGMVPAAAHAAGVGTLAELRAAIEPGTDATVTLTSDIWAHTEPLIIDRDVTLDLNGYTLMTDSFTVAADTTVTLVAGSEFRSYLINVDGTLQLGSDLPMQAYAVVTVSSAGKIESDSTPRTISGAQEINNLGTITAQVGPTQQVSGNNFTVRFVDNLAQETYQTVQVFAPTLQAAGIAPPAFARVHASIDAWNSESDGSGTVMTEATQLGPWNMFFAQWIADGVTSFDVSYLGSPSPTAAGSIGLVATDTSPGNDGGDITDLVDFASDDAADTIDGDLFYKSLVAELAGDRLVTGRLQGAPTVLNSVIVPVTHSGFPAEMSLTMTPVSVVVGGSSVAFLNATDEFGNSFFENLIFSGACEYCEVTLSSSDPTDVVDPDTGVITFMTPGFHTITALVDMGEGGTEEVTATVNVTAVPAEPTVPKVPRPPVLVKTGLTPSLASPRQAPSSAMASVR